MQFDIVGSITEQRTIAVGRSIRDLALLVRKYGSWRWRKMAGRAWVRLTDGSLRLAELHWYEASGIGRRRMKIKRYLDAPL
ncbi:MAG: hypothetical protein ACREOC_16180 [Gemmatimonadales bacterium]